MIIFQVSFIGFVDGLVDVSQKHLPFSAKSWTRIWVHAHTRNNQSVICRHPLLSCIIYAFFSLVVWCACAHACVYTFGIKDMSRACVPSNRSLIYCSSFGMYMCIIVNCLRLHLGMPRSDDHVFLSKT
ncbi:unnamed protein product [Camellia sinensis]